MSASSAIAMVSLSLKAYLEGEMDITPQVDVTILAPDESQANRRINLFLYKVIESPYQRNMDWQVSHSNPSTLVPPPLTLNLFYLMTPYFQRDPNEGNANAHAALGEAMRIFHENPVVPDTYLEDGLVDAREQVKVTPSTLDMDELTKIWGTFNEPYRLSVPYEVSVVQIDQSDAEQQNMAPRVRQVGVPDVRAPYQPPVVTDMSPTSGAAGSNVTFHGEDLDGWQAYVKVFGRRIVSGLAISGDSFTVTLPGDLPQGFHHIQVDVSHLHRRQFLFEVTS